MVFPPGGDQTPVLLYGPLGKYFHTLKISEGMSFFWLSNQNLRGYGIHPIAVFTVGQISTYVQQFFI